MKSSNHDVMKCSMNCLHCEHSDCINETPPVVDLDDYLSLHFYRQNELYSALDSATVPPADEQCNLNELISDDLRAYCAQKGIEPCTKADIAILERCMSGEYSGKKLEKALYKVRHRDKVRLSKKRGYIRRKYRQRYS